MAIEKGQLNRSANLIVVKATATSF